MTARATPFFDQKRKKKLPCLLEGLQELNSVIAIKCVHYPLHFFQKMGDGSERTTVLTPEERRERRRAKILAASDERLARILSGPEGGETRMAPAMEGGDFRASTIVDSNADTNGRANAALLDADDVPSFPSLTEMGVKYEPPRLFTYVRTARCKVVVGLGLLFFMLSTLDVLSSVLLPWSILFVSYSIVEKKKISSASAILRSKQQAAIPLNLNLSQSDDDDKTGNNK
ncbi:hypothetical protein PMAYCL1PPCAC_18447 [Pristionchus mayeri]|uniref:Uncharacterized protein n=1 Tax=Pristionchus mayeri TaxID=1317129 RepID=A0AAN5I1B2_9BILA|nr:hypothetical protein PMAYCL1PPCAC_18447 [Pristionchus mayeri]